MNLSFFFMVISASALPLLAFLALLLRRNLFKGKMRVISIVVGVILLSIVVVDTIHEHGATIGPIDIIISIITALLTLFILSHFSHGHMHKLEEEGAKGIVVSEAFHSLLDGAVIGATYLINPLIGYAATIGILMHELPKIIGTLTLFRSVGLSVKRTIFYGFLAQIGSPVAALLIFVLGKHVNDEQFQALEIASVSSLAAIVAWIIYLELRHHRKHPGGGNHEGHNH